MAMLEWNGKHVTINDVPAYDDPYHAKVILLIEAVGWDSVGASLKDFYSKVVVDETVCPQCGGAFQLHSGPPPTDKFQYVKIPNIEPGWCLDCYKLLLRTIDDGKVYSYPYSRCGYKKVWRHNGPSEDASGAVGYGAGLNNG